MHIGDIVCKISLHIRYQYLRAFVLRFIKVYFRYLYISFLQRILFYKKEIYIVAKHCFENMHLNLVSSIT